MGDQRLRGSSGPSDEIQGLVSSPELKVTNLRNL